MSSNCDTHRFKGAIGLRNIRDSVQMEVLRARRVVVAGKDAGRAYR